MDQQRVRWNLKWCSGTKIKQDICETSSFSSKIELYTGLFEREFYSFSFEEILVSSSLRLFFFQWYLHVVICCKVYRIFHSGKISTLMVMLGKYSRNKKSFFVRMFKQYLPESSTETIWAVVRHGNKIFNAFYTSQYSWWRWPRRKYSNALLLEENMTFFEKLDRISYVTLHIFYCDSFACIWQDI